MLRRSQANNSRCRSVAKVLLSTTIQASPRQIIIENLLKLRQINSADDASAKYDIHNLPEDLKGLERYASSTSGGASDTFVKDPQAWQNMSALDFVAQESSRDETWPFMVGGLCVFLLFCVALPNSLSDEMRKKSKYISMIEGRHGKLETSDNGHH